MKLFSKDKRFFVFAIVAMVAIFASMQLAHWQNDIPSIDAQAKAKPEPLTEELRKEVISSIRLLTGVDLRERIQLNENRPTIINIYTSWCPHCRKALPYLLNYKKQGFFDNANVLFISIDREPEKFVSYIGEYQYHNAFTPYLYKEQRRGDILEVVGRYGMRFNGGIPYVAVLGADGKLLAESTSRAGWRDIDREIKALRPN